MFIRPCEGRLTSSFQKNRLDPVEKKVIRDHNGVDFAKLGVVPIKTVADGKVVLVRKENTFGTLGNVIMIEHNIKGQIYTSVYAHLANIATAEGRVVEQGQNIGGMGSTGNSTGQHLHFELHKGRCLVNGKMTYAYAVDPMMYLPLEVALKLGDKGPNVELIQSQFKNAGYSITVDGDFGPATEKVARAFQKDNNLTVDGIVGPGTQIVLSSIKPTKPSNVEVSDWIEELNAAIEYVQKEGISDGTRPNEPLTRGQLFVTLHRIEKNK